MRLLITSTCLVGAQVSKSKRVTVRLDEEQYNRLLNASHTGNAAAMVRKLIDLFLDEKLLTPRYVPAVYKPSTNRQTHFRNRTLAASQPAVPMKATGTGECLSTPGQAAKYFGVTIGTLNIWRQKGIIPYFEMPNGKYMYKIDEVKEVFYDHKVESTHANYKGKI